MKKSYVYLLTTFMLWGSLYVVSQFVLGKIPTFTVAMFRYLIAFIALSLISLKSEKEKIEKSDYKYFFIMGFIGYFMKKNKWWGLLILTPILLLLGFHFSNYMGQTMFNFPFHLLTALFCFATLLLYPVCIFSNKKVKISGVIISTVIITAMSVILYTNKFVYNTTIISSSFYDNGLLNEKCNVYLEDDSIGKVNIEYSESLKCYIIGAKFTKAGKTNLIIVDENNKKNVYELNVGNNTYEVIKK